MTNFSKNAIFSKISKNRRAAAPAARPLKYSKKPDFSKIGRTAPGSVLGRFGLEIRILRENLYRGAGRQFKPVFRHFLKTWFSINRVFAYFFTFDG